MRRERTISMTTKSRLRNLALPLGLAAAAAILVGIYIISYRNSVTHGAGLVKVLIATRDIPAGTDGAAVASGGYMKTETVPRRAVAPGSITSGAALTSLVTAAPILKGEQITLRQFSPAAQGGIFAKFSGNERVVVVPGDPNQLLAGTMTEGDHVDIVATARYHFGSPSITRSTTKVVLRNLLVLKAPGAPKAGSVTSGMPSMSATLVMTDRQAQTMGWALKNTNWFAVLRPTKQPRNSRPKIETLFTFLSGGLGSGDHIIGAFPESVDDGK
jgi:Flp pilus assembly protein CpaB